MALVTRTDRTFKVLVIDDSRTIRRLIAAIVEETAGLELAGSVESAEEGLTLLRQPGFEVDVISLDIELPGMNGIEFLKRLHGVREVPVLVVSGHTPKAADLTIDALEAGAVDVIQKPDAHPSEIDRFIADTAQGLMRAAQSNRRARPAAPPVAPAPPQTASQILGRAPAAGAAYDPEAIICIGASTGGVPAVCKVVAGLTDMPLPIVVVQHMPPTFTSRLAARLAQTTGLPAHEVRDGQRLTPRTVWVAPGGFHLRLQFKSGAFVGALSEEDPVSGHKPSIDVLFHSAARQAGGKAVGVLLTGMGRDGADGLLAMRRAGAHTIVQDEATCVVYGMPKAAVQLGAAAQVLALDRIADAVHSSLNAAGHGRSMRDSSGRSPRMPIGASHG
ncbi:MAG: chemotaxis-specific protein-glutamate methyltransferase CheB [Alsobacter sp.]